MTKRGEDTKGRTSTKHKDGSEEKLPHMLRLPGFLIEEEIGLGDVVKHMTSAVGIRPCSGCLRRAATLNRWVVLSNRNRR